MPRHVPEHGTETRSRSQAFLVPLAGGLMLLSTWWNLAPSAEAASYPPALGCAVSGVTSAGSGLLQVRGTGFGAGSRVVVGVDGQRTGIVIADAAGSFQAAWLNGALVSGATVTAADAGCSTTGLLTIENEQGQAGQSPPSAGSGPGSTVGRPGPGKHQPGNPGPSSPEPAPPTGPPAAAIPSIPAVPLTGLPPQLVLGLAATVLLAGAALTGLAGRLGHRSERPARPDHSVVSAPPTPGTT